MDKKSAVIKVEKYAELIKDYVPLKKVILFGSHARGTATESSDIDVAVITDEITQDFLMCEAKLFELTDKIDIMIEPVLFEDKEDPSGFLDEVIKTGELIWQR